MLTGAAPRLFYDVGRVPSRGDGGDGAAGSGDPAYTSGQWKLVVEATVFVTSEVIVVWSGMKTGGNDPSGVYARVDGLDPAASIAVEGV